MTKYLLISFYLTKLYVTLSFKIASSVKYSESRQNFSNSVQGARVSCSGRGAPGRIPRETMAHAGGGSPGGGATPLQPPIDYSSLEIWKAKKIINGDTDTFLQYLNIEYFLLLVQSMEVGQL